MRSRVLAEASDGALAPGATPFVGRLRVTHLLRLHADMVATEELALATPWAISHTQSEYRTRARRGGMVREAQVAVDTTVVKTAIKKSFARTQIATQAKKKKASKARGYRR